jgi:heme/copper-type cytochrome/quinol oxidase subunit 2
MVVLLWLCAAITIGVFAVMLYSVVTFPHRAISANHRLRTLLVEILWFSVPILIFLGAITPVLTSLASSSE